jgi:hypothetical protein
MALSDHLSKPLDATRRTRAAIERMRALARERPVQHDRAKHAGASAVEPPQSHTRARRITAARVAAERLGGQSD